LLESLWDPSNARDHIYRGWSVVDVLNDRPGKLNVPVLGGIYAGHDLTDDDGDYDQTALPLGTMARIDVDRGTLTVRSLMCL